MIFTDKESAFVSVGRFTFIGFQPQKNEPEAVISFKCDKMGPAHSRLGDISTIGRFSPISLAILIDSMNEGPEREYLDTIHQAIECLANATASLTCMFDVANRNLQGMDVVGVDKEIAQNARDILSKYYKLPKKEFGAVLQGW